MSVLAIRPVNWSSSELPIAKLHFPDNLCLMLQNTIKAIGETIFTDLGKSRAKETR